ncbi:cytochrome P450 [Pisolithus tinctorius]|nr:cytochrome P450 [Pisolithus tinctorius]
MDASTVFVRIYDNLQEIIRSTTAFDIAKGVAILWALRISFCMARKKLKATRLRGPPRTSLIFGLAKDLFHAEDAGAMYEAWANEYGVAYEVPIMLGGSKIMLCDPRAIAHFYIKETRTYVHTDFGLIFTRKSFGMVILCAQGEEHRRQAIRQLLPVFYHSAYKAKAAWESLIDANDGHSTVIDVQNWLDSIGLAGFSHDFGSLDGKTNSVADVFTTFEGSVPNSTLLLLATVFPLLTYVPTSRGDLFGDMNRTLADISRKFLERSKEEKEAGIVDGKDDKSIIGVLLKAKDSGTDVQLSVEEILAQYDQLTNNLPYLDAVVHETLRFHPPLDEFVRQAAEDDVIPLSEPVRTRSGRVVNSISVTRGTRIGISTACINRSVAIWGADAKRGSIPKKAQEMQGYRHLLTFIDGPRTCLGKGFAVAEFKTVMFTLIKNFVLEMRDGPDTKIEMTMGILSRPRVVGEAGTKVPLRVRRYGS